MQDITRWQAERDSALAAGDAPEAARLGKLIAERESLLGISAIRPLPDELALASGRLTPEEEAMIGVHPDTLAALRAEARLAWAMFDSLAQVIDRQQ